MLRRLAGATLFGLGLLCLLAAAALVWVIIPSQLKFPYNLRPPDITMEAENATFVQPTKTAKGGIEIGVQHAALRTVIGIRPDFDATAKLTGPLAGHTLIWNVYQATDRVEPRAAINRSESHIALDRTTGAAVPWSGQCYNDVKEDGSADTGCTPGNISFAGHLYLFPFNTQKKTYQYWDSTLLQALPIQYKGEERYAGMPTYRFEQVVSTRQIDMDHDQVTALLAFLAPKAKSGTVTYQATRTMWVEPLTGSTVGYREQQSRILTPDVGAPIPLIDASFGYDKATAQKVQDETAKGRSTLLLLGRYVPIGLAVNGVLLLVLGYLVARRAGANRGRPPAEPPTAVEPAAAEAPSAGAPSKA